MMRWETRASHRPTANIANYKLLEIDTPLASALSHKITPSSPGQKQISQPLFGESVRSAKSVDQKFPPKTWRENVINLCNYFGN